MTNTVVDPAAHNRALYLMWLRTNFPELYARATGASNDGLSGILDTIGSTFNSIVNNVTQALPQLATTYTQYRTQEQLIQANSQRAAQGLPPLVYQNGQLVPMTGGTYTEVDYQTAQTAGLSTGSVVMIGAAVLIVVLLLTQNRGRR